MANGNATEQAVSPRTADASASGPASRAHLTRLLPSPLYQALRRVKYGWHLLGCYRYDMGRVWKYTSAVDQGDSKMKLQALMTMAYHSLEKGLSLKNPRVAFGRQHVETLLERLEKYKRLYGMDPHSRVALNVLYSYLDYNRENGHEDPELFARIEAIGGRAEAERGDALTGGTKPMTRQELHRMARIDLREFFESRSSVRQYSDQPVDPALIEQAVVMAQKTPSVCNRQSSRVWMASDPEKIATMLEIQGGTRGFSEQVNKLLVVTSDLSHFQSSGERNQCYVDGGLFAMSLVYALHSLGLATCTLVWSANKAKDRRLKDYLGMNDAETVIMMIAVGHPLEEFRVAQSTRKPLNEVLVKV